MRPLAIIPVYLTESADVALLAACVETLCETTRDGVEVLLVDDYSPAQNLLTDFQRDYDHLGLEVYRKVCNSGFCSPPDESILTASDGYVEISELDPTIHGLVGYSSVDSRIMRGGPTRPCGYPFQVGSRGYDGRLLAIHTQAGVARVTPNHGVTARWNKKALAGAYAVYVLRRGKDWRVGMTKFSGPLGEVNVRGRLKNQFADEAWILSIHNSKHDALEREMYLSWAFGVPTLQFRLPTHAGPGSIGQERLDDVWRRLNTRGGGHSLLEEFGRDPDQPLYTRSLGGRKRFPIQAINLMPGWMHIPTATGTESQPRWEDFNVEEGAYRGDVYSLDVEPHGHYVDNGVVVHNSQTVNVGLRRARNAGQDAILVNADIEFHDPDWLTQMLTQRNLHSDGLASVVGARLLFPNGIIQHGGVYFSLLTRSFDHMHKFAPGDLVEAHNPRACPVTGALQLIRNEALVEVGIYDEDFKMGFEDVDYGLRTFLSGRECVYCPGAVATHHESVFRGKRSKKLDAWHKESANHLGIKYQDVNMATMVPFL